MRVKRSEINTLFFNLSNPNGGKSKLKEELSLISDLDFNYGIFTLFSELEKAQGAIIECAKKLQGGEDSTKEQKEKNEADFLIFLSEEVDVNAKKIYISREKQDIKIKNGAKPIELSMAAIEILSPFIEFVK